jgi:hypothetical protein
MGGVCLEVEQAVEEVCRTCAHPQKLAHACLRLTIDVQRQQTEQVMVFAAQQDGMQLAVRAELVPPWQEPCRVLERGGAAVSFP